MHATTRSVAPLIHYWLQCLPLPAFRGLLHVGLADSHRARAAARASAAAEAGLARPDPPAWLVAEPGLPAEMAGLLAVRTDGACAFHRRRTGAPGCGLHAHRPASCEHFPFVCVTDPRGVHVTLSHYCPTAAALLFEDGDGAIVEGPPVLAHAEVPEGLDAREALPPVDDHGRGPAPTLMSWEGVWQWQHAFVEPSPATGRCQVRRTSTLRACQAGRPAAVDLAPRAAGVRRSGVAGGTPLGGWTPVIGRYLAAKAHASWALHLGHGSLTSSAPWTWPASSCRSRPSASAWPRRCPSTASD